MEEVLMEQRPKRSWVVEQIWMDPLSGRVALLRAVVLSPSREEALAQAQQATVGAAMACPSAIPFGLPRTALAD